MPLPVLLQHYSIGQVAHQTGQPASTLRYWESIGLIPRPARVSGRRSYAPDIFQRVALIELCTEAGFTLDEVRIVVESLDAGTLESRALRQLALDKLDEVELRLRRTRAMKRLLKEALDCECVDVSACLRTASGKRAGRA